MSSKFLKARRRAKALTLIGGVIGIVLMLSETKSGAPSPWVIPGLFLLAVCGAGFARLERV